MRTFPPSASRRPVSLLALLCLGLTTVAPPLSAQQMRTDVNADWCQRDRQRDGDRARHCEVRSVTIPATGELDVEASPNGGIDVEAWDRNEISIEAKVQTHARDEEDARRLASDIEVVVDGDRVRTDAPRSRGMRGDRRGWSVSYRVRVPHRTDLRLRSVNGGIAIQGVTGDIDMTTTNGGLSLRDVGGDVRGRSTNGGISATLAGRRWDGPGLDLQTTNGGIHLALPDGYSARLETGSVHGGFEIDFPVTVQGRMNPRRLSVDLGDGGPTIRAMTTNGGVTVRRL